MFCYIILFFSCALLSLCAEEVDDCAVCFHALFQFREQHVENMAELVGLFRPGAEAVRSAAFRKRLFKDKIFLVEQLVRRRGRDDERRILALRDQTQDIEALEMIRLDTLPSNVEEMLSSPSFDQKNEYAVAAYTVAALLRYTADKEDGKAMIDLLNGPESPSNLDLQMMDERIGESDERIRSYFKGATPGNDYTPSLPYRVEVLEYKSSRDVENYLYLYLPSGGADEPRQIQLRKKPSTGEWFIWEFRGLLMDVRIPVSQDGWA